MRFRSSKAAGSFDCTKAGMFELLVHIEADPRTESFAAFDFATILPARKADELSDLTAFLLRHHAGIFVLSTQPERTQQSPRFKAAWQELDLLLAKRSIWLLSTTLEDLRREPAWSNALELARCAQEADIDPEDHARVVAHLKAVESDSLHACMKLCAASADSSDAILHLVANGTLCLDPPGDLSPSSTLHLAPPRANDSWPLSRVLNHSSDSR